MAAPLSPFFRTSSQEQLETGEHSIHFECLHNHFVRELGPCFFRWYSQIISSGLTVPLEALSNEFIAAIFSELQSSGGRKSSRRDLYSVSLCCRRFSELVKPYLYQRFIQRGRHNATTFLRALLENAQLRTYVKHIDLSSSEVYLESGEQCFELPFLSGKDGDWLQGYLPDLDSEYSKNWQEALFVKKKLGCYYRFHLMLCSRNVEILRLHSKKSSVQLLRGILELADRSQRNPGT